MQKKDSMKVDSSGWSNLTPSSERNIITGNYYQLFTMVNVGRECESIARKNIAEHVQMIYKLDTEIN